MNDKLVCLVTHVHLTKSITPPLNSIKNKIYLLSSVMNDKLARLVTHVHLTKSITPLNSIKKQNLPPLKCYE